MANRKFYVWLTAFSFMIGTPLGVAQAQYALKDFELSILFTGILIFILSPIIANMYCKSLDSDLAHLDKKDIEVIKYLK